MKKWIVLIFSCLLLVGCNETTKQTQNLQERVDTYPNAFQAESDDFRYELQVNKSTISSGDPIEITASLTYIGEKEEIVITHAASPFYYELKETTRGYDIGYPMDQPLIATTLKKGEPLQHKYVTSGGYGDQSEEAYRTFMKQYLSGNYPVGYYVVKGYALFGVDGAQGQMELGGNIGFEVK